MSCGAGMGFSFLSCCSGSKGKHCDEDRTTMTVHGSTRTQGGSTNRSTNSRGLTHCTLQGSHCLGPHSRACHNHSDPVNMGEPRSPRRGIPGKQPPMRVGKSWSSHSSRRGHWQSTHLKDNQEPQNCSPHILQRG
jgi:hypothetical protein